MKFVRESEAPKDVFPPPYSRTITQMVTPWTVGSQHVWLGICEYPSGSTSNPHSHSTQEETFYCIGGSGQIKVDDTVFDLVPGDAVLVEPGETHMCMNLHGTENFKVVAIVTPPFSREGFSSDHTPK